MTVLFSVFRLIGDLMMICILLVSFMPVLEMLPPLLESVMDVPQLTSINFIVPGCYTLMALLIIVDIIYILVSIVRNLSYEREEVIQY